MLNKIVKFFSSEKKQDPETLKNDVGVVQSAQACFDKANEAFERNDEVAALDLYANVIQIDPNFAKARVMLGFLYQQRGNISQAKLHLAKALEVNSSLADAHYLLGAIAAKENHAQLMRTHFDASLAIDPQQEQIYREYSFAEYQLGRLPEAIDLAQRGLQFFPENLSLLQYLGNFCLYDKQYEAASLAYIEALQFDPTSVDLLYNLVICYTILLKYDLALETIERILQVDPHHVMANFERGILNLQRGDYARGWSGFEWRWSTPHLQRVRFKSSKPRWDGTQDLAGKTILVLSEQGYGDTLQFCRFIPMLKDLGATIHFVVLKPLIELMQQVPGVDQLLDETDILPPYDFTCELMSLPHLLNVTLENLPANTPYIVAPEKNISAWQGKIDTQKPYRVGIVWGGNPSHTNNHLRSIPISDIRVLFEQNAEFIVLQKEATEEERSIIQQYPNVQFLGDQIGGFGDTAALVELVDLVITVDTSVAHLAGAMGKNTWVLVSHHPDWRWLLQRADSPWYPTVRLFRQQYGDNWSVAVSQVAAQLLTVINQSQENHL